ncbi:MAG: group I truncated hemoglobin, partial [Candidatus Eiseniibacteriota bacterium]
NQAFADTDFEVFKLSLAKYLGALCGGPALYKGPDMKTVHSGLGVSNSQFDAVVEDLGAVLAALEVDPVARAELLARLQPLRGEIVGH